MLQAKSKVIDGLEYRVTQLGAKEGRRLLTRLLKVAGPAIGDAASGSGMGPALERVAASLTEGDVDYLCDTLSKSTEVQVSDTRAPQLSDIFDAHFAGQYPSMLKWLAFALEVNFGSFLDMAREMSSAVNASPVKAAE